jgi:hypothetical protein
MKDGVPPSCLFLKSSGFLQQGDWRKQGWPPQDVNEFTRNFHHDWKFVFKYQVHGKPVDEPGSDAMPLTLVSLENGLISLKDQMVFFLL